MESIDRMNDKEFADFIEDIVIDELDEVLDALNFALKNKNDKEYSFTKEQIQSMICIKKMVETFKENIKKIN